ncbi:MFS transporter [Streptomyces mirabilis]|uniref:MFS transporter n=1 Tax=Streptomyces mirabilis TaxID=68239 RepID=UPI00382752CA
MLWRGHEEIGPIDQAWSAPAHAYTEQLRCSIPVLTTSPMEMMSALKQPSEMLVSRAAQTENTETMADRTINDETTVAGLFWRFWTATAASGVGSAVSSVALPLIAVFTLHASTFQVSLLAAAGQVGWLILGLPAGVIVQRYPLRSLQVTMDLVRMAAIGSIPLAWALDALTYTHLLVVTLLVGLATVLFDIGSATFLPRIIDTEELNSRNSLMSGTFAVTQTGGPSLGGFLIQAAGPAGAVLVDAASYLVSAVTLRGLPEHYADSTTKARLLPQIREGWTFVINHPVMFPCMLWATGVNFVNGALAALVPTYLVRVAELSPFIVGLLIAMDGVGTLLGAALTTKLAAKVGTARALFYASIGGGGLTLMMPLTTRLDNAYFFGLGYGGFAASVVIGSILTRTHRQTDSPADLLSRVMATVRFVSWGALPVGALLAGVFATLTGLRPAFWMVCGAALIAPATLALSSVPRRRDLSDALHREEAS